MAILPHYAVEKVLIKRAKQQTFLEPLQQLSRRAQQSGKKETT